MSTCPDCAEMTLRYGAPDRRCDRHWREDNPGGVSMKFEVTEVNRQALELYFGLNRAGGSTP